MKAPRQFNQNSFLFLALPRTEKKYLDRRFIQGSPCVFPHFRKFDSSPRRPMSTAVACAATILCAILCIFPGADILSLIVTTYPCLVLVLPCHNNQWQPGLILHFLREIYNKHCADSSRFISNIQYLHKCSDKCTCVVQIVLINMLHRVM